MKPIRTLTDNLTPAQREKCRTCGKPLQPVYKHRDVRVEVDGGYETVMERVGLYGYGYNAAGYFCSLRCGWTYALRAVKKGP